MKRICIALSFILFFSNAIYSQELTGQLTHAHFEKQGEYYFLFGEKKTNNVTEFVGIKYDKDFKEIARYRKAIEKESPFTTRWLGNVCEIDISWSLSFVAVIKVDDNLKEVSFTAENSSLKEDVKVCKKNGYYTSHTAYASMPKALGGNIAIPGGSFFFEDRVLSPVEKGIVLSERFPSLALCIYKPIKEIPLTLKEVVFKEVLYADKYRAMVFFITKEGKKRYQERLVSLDLEQGKVLATININDPETGFYMFSKISYDAASKTYLAAGCYSDLTKEKTPSGAESFGDVPNEIVYSGYFCYSISPEGKINSSGQFPLIDKNEIKVPGLIQKVNAHVDFYHCYISPNGNLVLAGELMVGLVANSSKNGDLITLMGPNSIPMENFTSQMQCGVFVTEISKDLKEVVFSQYFIKEVLKKQSRHDSEISPLDLPDPISLRDFYYNSKTDFAIVYNLPSQTRSTLLAPQCPVECKFLETGFFQLNSSTKYLHYNIDRNNQYTIKILNL